jgi:hypothetical protein
MKTMISTFEQVWDQIDGDNKLLMGEVLEALQKEIDSRESLVLKLLKPRGIYPHVEQEYNAFKQVKYGIQDLPYQADGNETDLWKAARAKRPEIQEREKEAKSRWKANADFWDKFDNKPSSEIEDLKFEMSSPEAAPMQEPNMAEVQAAEMKASIVQNLDKSADGNTQIEGQDIGYEDEGYMTAANQVQYEAQRARTANNEQQAQSAGIEESINPKIGQRVAFHAHGTKTKLVGKVVDMDEETVTLQSGRALIPAIRNKGTFTEAPELEATHTKEYAKAQAQKHVGDQGNVFMAKSRGTTYKGVITELTPTFAIQKVNAETAILHRLKDLEAREKDGHGTPKNLRENEDFHLIQEGKEVSITKESLRDGGVMIEPWDREREEKQRVRERERSRGSQTR